MSGEKTYGPGNDNYGRDKKLPQTKLSVEEAAHRFAHNKIFPVHGAEYAYSLLQQMLAEREFAKECFLAGHTHALANSNLIELDKVVEVLEEKVAYLKLTATNTTKAGKYACGVAIDQIQESITQIKQLSNKV